MTKHIMIATLLACTSQIPVDSDRDAPDTAAIVDLSCGPRPGPTANPNIMRSVIDGVWYAQMTIADLNAIYVDQDTARGWMDCVIVTLAATAGKD